MARSLDQVQDHRQFVRQFLSSGQFLIFNNGDPILFNSAASAFLGALQVMASRGTLKELDSKGMCAIARRPIEIVSDLQREFGKETARVVGGRIHDLVIAQNGTVFSTSGDDR
jgi:hypothetical protein